MEEEIQNRAVVFVKPHANNSACVEFVQTYLEEHGLVIVNKAELKKQKLQFLIDDHYTVLSSGAYYVSPRTIAVDRKTKACFFKTFSESWEKVSEEGRILNVRQYFFLKNDSNPEALRNIWDDVSTIKFKLSDGMTLGRVFLDINHKPYYVLNGFYPALKSKFIQTSSSVTAFIVEFNEEELSWADFRQKLIGASNPEKAAQGSLRRSILENWRSINLNERPSMGDNGVHASAGPIEGLRERLLWFSDEVSLENDEFALALQHYDIEDEEIFDMFCNYDLFEETKEMSSTKCIEYLLSRQGVSFSD